MSHDILQPIPQGGYGAYDEENRKIQGIADELQRLCRIHEEEFGDSQTNGGSLEIEQRISELYAKNHNLWIPIDYMFDLGVPGPSGNENDTYVSENTIFKVNNLFNSGSIVKLFYIVWDIVPRNVLVDEDGDLYVVDAEITISS